MGILLGLSAALSWGFADFLARYLTRRVGTLRTLLYMQAAGFVLLTLALPWLGGWGRLTSGLGPWAWAVLTGLVNAGGMLAFYRSLQVGKLAVVTPISASAPALTVLLSLLAGERLSVVRGAGIVFTLIGVVLVAAALEAPTAKVAAPRAEAALGASDGLSKRTDNQGVVWAIAAAVGFGMVFWLMGFRVVPRVGAAAGVWVIRLITITTTLLAALIARQPVQLRPVRLSWIVLGAGLLDTGGFVLNNLGMIIEQISVVSVLSSLYGAVTVALAAILLHETLARRQWIGVLLIFAGIALISA
jgi:drug/metabolite transporter (DMT)-like permease